MANLEPPASVNNNSNTINDRTSLYLAIIAFGISFLAMGMFLVERNQTQNAERETRMLEYYILELDGKLMGAGVIDAKDSYSANKRKESK
jgi:uncharacterized membrane protein YidH (DUF202 family)